MEKIFYSSGYKYVLEEAYSCKTPITGVVISHDQFLLELDGTLTIYKGWPWDGASGPTFDSKSSMRPSMIHDVFCYAMRSELLSYSEYQDTVNKFFKQQCIEDGMWEWRAHLWYLAVEAADCGNPNQGSDRIVESAP